MAGRRDEDGKGGKKYEAEAKQDMYVSDKEGTMLSNMGAINSVSSTDKADIDMATNYGKTSMAALAQGELPDPASTRPYGCSVKY